MRAWDAFVWAVISFGAGLAIYMFTWEPPPIPPVVEPPPDYEEFVEPVEPVKVQEPPKVELVYVESRFLDVTCYHRWSDSPPSRGRYANYDDDRLPISERIINDSHYTVALTLGMDKYHTDLVRLPDGLWTHRYRIHVPGYNSNDPSSPAFLSVPRDRMPSKWSGRLDILFTGCREICEAKARNWGKKTLRIHIYEVKVYAP